MQPSYGRRPRRWPWILVLAAVVLLVGWVWEPWRDPPPPDGPDPTTLEGVVEIAQAGPERPGSLAAYWKATLARADPAVALEQPGAFVPYQLGALPESECLQGSVRNNALYCQGQIFWDEDWFQELHRLFGQVAPLAVLAHEYGHHISALLSDANETGERYSKQEELYADCLSGMYLRDANKKLILSNRELLLEAYEIYKSADPESDDPWFAAWRHGTGKERLGAVGIGFVRPSLRSCERYLDYHGDRVVDVGGYDIAFVPGVKVNRFDANGVRLKTTTGQSVDVRYLDSVEGETSAEAFERFRQTRFDDARLRPLGAPDELDHAYGTQLSQEYGMAFVRDGQRHLYHGIVQVIFLDEGGALGLNAFEPGPARGADPASWGELERALGEVEAGIWPDLEGG